jgi:hypothetical protein
MNSIDYALLLGNKQLILIKNSNSSRSLAVLTKPMHDTHGKYSVQKGRGRIRSLGFRNEA